MIDNDRIAWVLLDAIALGDGPAARKWGITRRTVERYRALAKTDHELSDLVAEKRLVAEAELSTLRVRFLRRALCRLEKKIMRRATTVLEIAAAVKIVGELHQVSEALTDERPDGPDPDAAEAPGDAGEPTHGPH